MASKSSNVLSIDSDDPEAVREALRLREEQKRRRDEDDFKWLMSDKRGRRVMWRLLAETGLYKTSFTGNSETFFREGARNVGLKLMAQIHELTPDAYGLMLKESKE